MKFLKWAIVILLVLGGLFYFIGMPYMKSQTKKISPERTATYTEDGMDMLVTYSAPYKKGRVIFGELVPYGKVWRTGANEPTTFETKTAITINGKELAAGTYSLWTIPRSENWDVIFNSEVPKWGVTLLSGGKETTRNPKADVLQLTVPTAKTNAEVERLTIAFSKTAQLYLSHSWDTTAVRVPINK